MNTHFTTIGPEPLPDFNATPQFPSAWRWSIDPCGQRISDPPPVPLVTTMGPERYGLDS